MTQFDPTTTPVVPYRSAARTPTHGCETRLFTCGILLVCLGAVFAFLTLLIPLGFASAPPAARLGAAAPVPTPLTVLPVILPFAVSAAAFIWTGIGSIRLRRWSRPLALSIAGIALFAGGVIVLQFTATSLMTYLFGPQTTPAPVRRGTTAPPSVNGAYLLGYVTGLLLVALGIPLVFFFAYRPRAVQQTLDEADPEPAWTDRCPLPLLGLAIALAYAAFITATSALTIDPAVAFFGTLLHREFAVADLLLLAVAFAGAAVLTYRLSPLGPWLAIALMTTAAASLILTGATFATQDPYAAPRPTWSRASTFEIQQAAQLATTRGMINTLLYLVPAVAYTLYARRHLPSGGE